MGANLFGRTRATFVRGGVDANGELQLTDLVRTLDHLFRGGAGPACKDRTDSNNDGSVDVSDAVYTLLFLFAGGNAPPAPIVIQIVFVARGNRQRDVRNVGRESWPGLEVRRPHAGRRLRPLAASWGRGQGAFSSSAAKTPMIRGRSRMRYCRQYGSVREAPDNRVSTATV
jgi:hypothetical protein